MQDQKQFEQLMLQYNQLKNGSIDIKRAIDNDDYDGAITMLKAREPIFFNCKCMRKYLELTPVQEKELDEILEELRSQELENMKNLQEKMAEVHKELKKAQQTEKIQQVYDIDNDQKGSIINYSE